MQNKEQMDFNTLLENILITAGIFIVATVLAIAFFHYSLNSTSVAIIYVLAVMLVARYTTNATRSRREMTGPKIIANTLFLLSLSFAACKAASASSFAKIGSSIYSPLFLTQKSHSIQLLHCIKRLSSPYILFQVYFPTNIPQNTVT